MLEKINQHAGKCSTVHVVVGADAWTATGCGLSVLSGLGG
jgi:hypothetical protein